MKKIIFNFSITTLLIMEVFFIEKFSLKFSSFDSSGLKILHVHFELFARYRWLSKINQGEDRGVKRKMYKMLPFLISSTF